MVTKWAMGSWRMFWLHGSGFALLSPAKIDGKFFGVDDVKYDFVPMRHVIATRLQ